MGPSFQTSQLLILLDRMRAGDRAAANDLFEHLGDRLRRLARKMLRGSFPAVGRWEETSDVLQKASQRLLRALKAVRPDSTRKFFTLAGVQIRRELLDLKEHYYGPEGMGAHHHTPGAPGNPDGPSPEPPDPAPGWDELEEWCDFHRKIDGLPEEEREVVDLHFYQGLTKAQVAELLGVDVRTVQRRWNGALTHLHAPPGGQSPGR
jgi:RNA polymerase sigma-70 factor (ECF subfamily)